MVREARGMDFPTAAKWGGGKDVHCNQTVRQLGDMEEVYARKPAQMSKLTNKTLKKQSLIDECLQCSNFIL